LKLGPIEEEPVANAQLSANTLVQHSNDRVEASSLNIPENEEKAPAPIDPSIDKWFYISGASA
jgi:inorganic pyrophosphatase